MKIRIAILAACAATFALAQTAAAQTQQAASIQNHHPRPGLKANPKLGSAPPKAGRTMNTTKSKTKGKTNALTDGLVIIRY